MPDDWPPLVQQAVRLAEAKLRSLACGAAIVRAELTGQRAPEPEAP